MINHTISTAERGPMKGSQLADSYLKSFGSVEPAPDVDQHKRTKKADNLAIHLSERAARAIVFNEIFAKSKRYQGDHSF